MVNCRGNMLYAQTAETTQEQSPQNPAPINPSEDNYAKDIEPQKEIKQDEIKKDLTLPAQVLEIRRLEAEEPLYSIELRDVELVDLFRVIAHDYNLNILVDKDVGGKITASFTNISLEEALKAIAEISNLLFEKKGNIIRISPHIITRAFNLKYIEARELLAAPDQTSSTAAADTESAAQTSTIYDLLSEKGRILLGKQPNSIIVIDYPTNIAKLEEYLKEMDRKMTSRVFKLKYLKATEVVGSASNTTSTSSSSATVTPAGTETSPPGSF